MLTNRLRAWLRAGLSVIVLVTLGMIGYSQYSPLDNVKGSYTFQARNHFRIQDDVTLSHGHPQSIEGRITNVSPDREGVMEQTRLRRKDVKEEKYDENFMRTWNETDPFSGLHVKPGQHDSRKPVSCSPGCMAKCLRFRCSRAARCLGKRHTPVGLKTIFEESGPAGRCAAEIAYLD